MIYNWFMVWFCVCTSHPITHTHRVGMKGRCWDFTESLYSAFTCIFPIYILFTFSVRWRVQLNKRSLCHIWCPILSPSCLLLLSMSSSSSSCDVLYIWARASSSTSSARHANSRDLFPGSISIRVCHPRAPFKVLSFALLCGYKTQMNYRGPPLSS